MDHLIDMLICQSHTPGTSYTRSLPHKTLILLCFHLITSQFSDGIVIKSSHHIKRAIKDIFPPDLYLNIPLIFIINICTFQDLCNFRNFLPLLLIRIFDPYAQPCKCILLRNGKIFICKSHCIDQRVYHRSLSDQGTDIFSRINTIHYRNDHRIIRNHIPDTLAHLCKRVIFHTDKNIILLSHIADCNDSFRSCNDLTFIITVQHKTIFPDALCSGSTCHHCHMRICFRQHSCHISANTADSDHCNSFLFCLHIICLLFPRISCISAIIKPLSPYNYS